MTHRTPNAISRTTRILATLAALTTMLVMTANVTAASASSSRTDRVCQTQTMAITNADVYQVCLTATDSWNGSQATGYVSGLSCNIYLPTGAGWFCDSQAHGSYRESNGTWEDWLNFRVSYVSPFVLYDLHYSNCIYLRVDTQPNGHTTFQNFANKNLPIGSRC